MTITWEMQEIAPPEEVLLEGLAEHSAEDVTPEDGAAMAGVVALPTDAGGDQP